MAPSVPMRVALNIAIDWRRLWLIDFKRLSAMPDLRCRGGGHVKLDGSSPFHFISRDRQAATMFHRNYWLLGISRGLAADSYKI